MNKVRQGILSRPLKDHHGRNNTTLVLSIFFQE